MLGVAEEVNGETTYYANIRYKTKEWYLMIANQTTDVLGGEKYV